MQFVSHFPSDVMDDALVYGHRCRTRCKTGARFHNCRCNANEYGAGSRATRGSALFIVSQRTSTQYFVEHGFFAGIATSETMLYSSMVLIINTSEVRGKCATISRREGFHVRIVIESRTETLASEIFPFFKKYSCTPDTQVSLKFMAARHGQFHY